MYMALGICQKAISDMPVNCPLGTQVNKTPQLD